MRCDGCEQVHPITRMNGGEKSLKWNDTDYTRIHLHGQWYTVHRDCIARFLHDNNAAVVEGDYGQTH